MSKRLILSIFVFVLSTFLRSMPITAPQDPERQNVETTKSRTSPPARVNDQGQAKEKKQETEEHRPKNTGPFPVSIQNPIYVIDEATAKQVKAYAEEQAKQWWKNPSWWAVILAALATAFAFGAFLANLSQAKHTRREADAAESQLALATRPRLYVDGVRVVNFEPGKQPIFFVKVINVGPAAAEKVTINIRVEPSSNYHGAKYDEGVHSVMIPANGNREHFIEVRSPLDPNIIAGFNTQNWPLLVTGYFEHDGKRVKYCYKYNPSNDPRPEGLPQFIPCDFHTQLVTLIRAGSTFQAELSSQPSNERAENGPTTEE